MFKIQLPVTPRPEKYGTSTDYLCLIAVKGHGSGCTRAVRGMHRYLYRMHCLTPPTSMCSDNTENLHRSTVQHPRPKFTVLATHQTL